MAFETLFKVEIMEVKNDTVKMKIIVDMNNAVQEMVYTRKVGDVVNLDLNTEEMVNRVIRNGFDVVRRDGRKAAIK